MGTSVSVSSDPVLTDVPVPHPFQGHHVDDGYDRGCEEGEEGLQWAFRGEREHGLIEKIFTMWVGGWGAAGRRKHPPSSSGPCGCSSELAPRLQDPLGLVYTWFFVKDNCCRTATSTEPHTHTLAQVRPHFGALM